MWVLNSQHKESKSLWIPKKWRCCYFWFASTKFVEPLRKNQLGANSILWFPTKMNNFYSLNIQKILISNKVKLKLISEVLKIRIMFQIYPPTIYWQLDFGVPYKFIDVDSRKPQNTNKLCLFIGCFLRNSIL